jgi:hypothetical protein
VLASQKGPSSFIHHHHHHHHHHHRVFAAVYIGAQTSEVGATVATLRPVNSSVPGTTNGTVVTTVTTVTISKGKGTPLQALTDS